MGYRVKPSRFLSDLASGGRRSVQRVSKKSHLPLTPDEETIEQKVEKLFSGKDLLFERLDAEPKLSVAMQKSLNSIRHNSKVAVRYVHKQPMLAKVAIITVLALSAGGITYISSRPNQGSSVSEVAGVSSGQSTDEISSGKSELSVKPSFTMVLPKGKKESQFKFARVSPDENAPTYAFIDLIGETKINISEQEVPKQFDYNRAVELERVAKDFQATNVIQIDEDKIYHGYSEKLRVQSLVFIKKDRLIFIKSPEKLSDDTWTGYILNLQ